MNICRLCQRDTVAMLLDFGKQPLCNRFLRDHNQEEYTHPLAVGQCQGCGVIQLLDPPPANELRPRFDWITYREPEPHLDRVADMIAALPGITEKSTIWGVSYKDDTTLRRLESRGLKKTWRIDLKTDLGIDDPCAGGETIQAALAPAIRGIVSAHGRADIVIARHILEHAHDIASFLEALKGLLNPGGYLVIESPDCRRALEQCDYSTVWEEHVFYFTPQTFRDCFASRGFSLVAFESFPYALENSLVAIAQVDEKVKAPSTPTTEKAIGQAFRDSFADKHDRLGRFLRNHRQTRGKIAFLGAGHLSCVFINVFGLQDCVEFVADDNPHKQGLLMPGSRLPIYGSSALLEKDIKLCLLCLSPESEDKVIQSNQRFMEQGGKFASIFAGSKYALKV
ncbi:MAG TPA: methyltransferase domain-containing protein [Verrucomicrobiae bacterium]|nr:methyltransferase domain-containing protein [Verrucomicrobiae bacterium]